jgi:hypothetical protein
MNTKWQCATAAVTGARHQRDARNGQDAVGAWLGADAAAIVVCDGCSAGAGSELGARLGAQLVIGALARRLARGAAAGDEATWCGVRDEVGGALARVIEQCGAIGACDREAALRESFLFTIVAAAVTRDEVAVWALGDGAYATLGTSSPAEARVLGPFADNAPPYVAYDLLGEPRAADLRVVPASGCSGVVIATDGVADLIACADEREAGDAGDDDGDDDPHRREHRAAAAAVLAGFATPALARPDALRRKLALLARRGETIDWDARRVVRVPAPLQDDCAVAALRWELAS